MTDHQLATVAYVLLAFWVIVVGWILLGRSQRIER